MKEKAKRARIIIFTSIILVDILLIPWLIHLPRYAIKMETRDWLEFGPINSILYLFKDSQYMKLFLTLQLLVVALIIYLGWNTTKFKKKNKVSDGVGGPEPSGNGQHGTSRWQTEEEMDKYANVWYTNEILKKGGIIFGMEEWKKAEKIWLNNEDAHTLIIGATRSGKGRRILLPSIWEIAQAEESMIFGDPKGELYISTKDYLEKEGYKVIALNLREPLKGNQWNMLEMVNKAVDEGNISKATELAWDIANAIVNQKPSTMSEPLWQNGEESTIAALLLLTAMESEFKFQRHMTTAYYLLAEYGQPLEDETIPLMEYLKSLDVKHPAKGAFATASIAPYKTRASFFTTALADLRLFSDPNIADMTSCQDHNLEDIGIEKTAVFLIIPDEKATRNVLATLYIDQVYQAMVDLANKRGGRIPRRVNYILDEFGNLPVIPNFDKKLTVAAGRGCKFTMAIQDLGQLKTNYDKKANTITGNCHNWIFLKTGEPETAKVISEKVGKYTVETDSSGSSIQNKGHSISQNISLTGRPLLLPDEILRWKSDESLILSMGLFPARYPTPDLGDYEANEAFGFVKTGDLDTDKELNRKIIEARWEQVEARQAKETSIWLPPIEIKQEMNEKMPKNYSEKWAIEEMGENEEEDFL